MTATPTREQHEIRWKRLDQPATERATLARLDDGWQLVGLVTGRDEAIGEYVLRYDVRVDAAWITRSAEVEGSLGAAPVKLRLTHDAAAGTWTRNGVAVPDLDGCIDVDLGFTPATNTLPIRRLSLAVGAAATVYAAWLRFPDFTVEVLEQRYIHEEPGVYHYESGGGHFRADLEVDAVGLVTRYGQYWVSEREASRAMAPAGRAESGPVP